MCLTLVVLALLLVRARGVLGAVDCVGKPYGYPGCPTRTVSSQQSSSLCGNAVVDEGEQCDDGTYYNGAADHTCSKDCVLRVCGDGYLDQDLGEECEPKTEEVYAMDPETGQLTTEKRFVGASCGTYCTAPVCNAQGSCNGGCQQKFLAACVSSSSQSSLIVLKPTQSSSSPPPTSLAASIPLCGNGALDTGETCDDGTRNSDARPDACRRDCRLPYCGDGISDKGEECDDSNRVPNDGCTNECRIGRCGNGLIEWGEQCDDGVRNSDLKPDACRRTCAVSRCGDGIVDRGEECDDSNKINVDNCTNDCRVSRCGDAIVQSGEQCDEGSRNADNRPDACRINCTAARCGDGVVDRDEECDDGNRLDNDACANTCRRSRCGDGVIQPGEQCDDGMRNSDVKANICRLDCLYPHCGDGVVDRGEECDGGLSCTAECRVLHAAATTTTGPLRTMSLSNILIAAVGGLFVTLVFVFRKQVIPYLTMFLPKKKFTIDDLPLSDIENPFHKW